jgi:hypothetical protein
MSEFTVSGSLNSKVKREIFQAGSTAWSVLKIACRSPGGTLGHLHEESCNSSTMFNNVTNNERLSSSVLLTWEIGTKLAVIRGVQLAIAPSSYSITAIVKTVSAYGQQRQR